MRSRFGSLLSLFCLLLAPAAFSQSKPILELKGAFTLDPQDRFLTYRFLKQDNNLVVVGTHNVRVLDPVSGTVVSSVALNLPELSQYASPTISPDGHQLFFPANTCSGKRKDKQPAAIWDLQTGKQITVLDPPGRPLCGAYWTSDGKRLTTSSANHRELEIEISFWDGETFKFLSSLPSDKITWWHVTEDGTECLYSIGPVKRLLMVANYLSDTSGPIEVWDIGSGKSKQTITSSDGNVETVLRGMMVSPDEKLLLFLAWPPKSNDSQRRLVVWELGQDRLREKPALKYEVKATPRIENSPDFSPDGKLIAMDAGESLQIYDSQTGQKKFELPGVKSVPNFWLDDDKILLFDRDKRMEALDPGTGKLLYQRKMVYKEATGFDMEGNSTGSEVVDYTRIRPHPNRDLLLTYSNQSVEILNSLTGEAVQTIVIPDKLSFGKKLSGLLKLASHWLKNSVSAAFWSPDGKTLCVVDQAETSVSFWRLTDE